MEPSVAHKVDFQKNGVTSLLHAVSDLFAFWLVMNEFLMAEAIIYDQPVII